MSVTIEEIVSPPSAETIKQIALEILQGENFPVTDWSDLSPARSLVESNAYAVEYLASFVVELAKSGFAGYAKGLWLDLLFESNYSEPRKKAVFAVKKLRLTNNSGGAIVIAAGDYLATPNAGEYTYKNITGGTLAAPIGSVLDLEFQSSVAGSDYNLTSSSWELVTPVAGVDVAELPSPTLVVSGTNEETDDQYVSRVRAKWSSIGAGATEGFIRYYALSASDEVKKVKIHKQSPSSIEVFLAGDSGPVSTSAVTAVDTVFNTDERRPLCHTITVSSCASYTVTITGSVNVLAAEKATAKANFEKALAEYQRQLPIGATVSRERIIQLVMSQMSYDDRNDLTLTSPASDVALAASQVAAFDISGLTWVGV